MSQQGNMSAGNDSTSSATYKEGIVPQKDQELPSPHLAARLQATPGRDDNAISTTNQHLSLSLIHLVYSPESAPRIVLRPRARIVARPRFHSPPPIKSPHSPLSSHLPSFPHIAMLEGKVIYSETDVMEAMQQHALKLAAKAQDAFDVINAIEIACYIKMELDLAYGHWWHCIVRTDFGSFVTHCHGCFIYFCIGSLAIMLFKGTALGPATETSPFPPTGTTEARVFCSSPSAVLYRRVQ